MDHYSEASAQHATPPNSSDGSASLTPRSNRFRSLSEANTVTEAKNSATSPLPILPHLQAWLTSSVVDFLVKTSAPAAKEKASTVQEVAYGDIFTEQSKKYALNMPLLRTLVSSREEGLIKSYAILPASGMMRNGVVFRLPNLGRDISETEHTYLPTPLANDGRVCYICSKEASLKALARRSTKMWIHRAIGLLDLPIGMANPQFSENMMGLPADYTLPNASKPAVTRNTGQSHT